MVLVVDHENNTRDSTVPEQASLDIPPSLEQIISDTKNRLVRQQERIELIPSWKYLSSVMSIVTSIVVFLLILGVLLLNANVLPPEIPLYYNSAIGTWNLVDKSLLLLIPVFYLAVVLIILRLSQLVFGFDSRLSRVAGWVLVVINFVILFSISQILALII